MLKKPNSKTDRARKKRKRLTQLTHWFKSIYELDGRKCMACGRTYMLSPAHHILSRSKFIEFIYELWNGILLCAYCHIKAERGDKILTARQWIIVVLERLPDGHRCKKALEILKKKEPV